MRLVPSLALVACLGLASPVMAEPLEAVIADYEQMTRASDPISAGFRGDREAMARLPDPSLAADRARARDLSKIAGRLARVDGPLDAEAALNREVLSWIVAAEREALAQDAARIPFTSDDGFHTLLPYLAQATPMRSLADAEAWTARLEAAPAYWSAQVENARRGVATGFTQPRMTVEAVIGQAKALSAPPIAEDPLMAPYDRLPDDLDDAAVAGLKARGLAAMDRLRAEQAAFVAFLEETYLPAARSSLAARDLPGGADHYAAEVRRHTTTELTPDEIHALGLAEVARIRAAMEAIRVETGFSGDLTAFIASLRTDTRFHAASRQELLEKASEMAKRADDQLPGWFRTLPRLPYGVRPVPAEVEAGYTTGRYFPGSPEQGVAGGYMVNTSALDQRPLYELPALTFHEAVPGHHLQIALAQEMTGVPDFRRDAGMSAFVEGWGLYAERLAGEMGLYRDPYERFGQLSYEMWRACRLVADTGLHWKRWSLDQARACFAENTALSPLNIEVELARYVSWPGQALAYKIGELRLIALRARAEAALGDAFDIRDFHDAVLLSGALPLDLLDARIEAWTAAQAAEAARAD